MSKHFSAISLVRNYRDLFEKAVTATGNLKPFIQQLGRYDDREIIKYESWIALSENVTLKVLGSGLMTSNTETEIRKQVAIFLEPGAGTQDHGRAISANEARKCELTVQEIDLKSREWKTIYDLYYRCDSYVSSRVAKLFESEFESFYEPRPGGEDE